MTEAILREVARIYRLMAEAKALDADVRQVIYRNLTELYL